MGRHGSKRSKRRDRPGRGRDDRTGQDSSFTRSPAIVREHTDLERYYNTLLDLDDGERAQFWTTLRRDLPNSFRFCGSKGHALVVQKLLRRRYIPQLTGVEFDGQPVRPPEPVPWFPDGLAWSMSTPKNVVRKFAPFATFQRFLVSETTVGNISRQEIVSMIPPLLLDVRPGMTVLDLCAAPGSKSAQLVEMLHAGEEARLKKALQSTSRDPSDSNDDEEDPLVDNSDDGRATGMLIANDSDYKRCHLLTHQLKRLSSPNTIVMNQDATMFPALRIPNPNGTETAYYLKFDRVLADVPCSGDGTLRKNIELWRNWSPALGLGLHVTQTRILVRALQLLKVGGRVVYSTCSMNPVEDEAVVAAAIQRCGGPETISIVDCRDQLPGLVRRPGLKSWKVMDRQGRLWSSWREVEEFTKQSEAGVTPSKLLSTMFPIDPNDEEAEMAVPLERCMRLFAHDQDTGAFFITVLEKKVEFKAKPEEMPTQPKPAVNGQKHDREEDGGGEEIESAKRQKAENPAANMETEEHPPAETVLNGLAEHQQQPPPPQQQPLPDFRKDVQLRKQKPPGPYEEPFKYLPADNATLQSVIQAYTLSPRFPLDRYMVRNAAGEPAKVIYYTSARVRDVLRANEGRANAKFVHAGVRMFVKQDAPSADVCRWRIQAEGMPLLHAHVGPARVLLLTRKETLRRLLVEMFPRTSGEEWRELGEVGAQIHDLPMGCYVLRVEPPGKAADAAAGQTQQQEGPGDEAEGPDEDFSERMVLPLWKSFHSVNLMLPKEDRSAMLLRIFNDTRPIINPGNQKKKEQEEQNLDDLDSDVSGEVPANGMQVEGGEEEQEAHLVAANGEPTGPLENPT